MLWEPADWIITAGECVEGNCSGLEIVFAMAPFIPGSAGKYMDDIIGLLPSPSRADFPWHHLLPQQKDLAGKFARLGINIDEHMVSLPLDVHKEIHLGAGGGLWNEAWEKFFENNPNSTKEEVFKYIGVLIYQFGLDGLIHRIP